MRVLFEVVHPAHVLFFCHAMRALQARGATICIASRHKDVTTDLLDRLGFDHVPLSRARSGIVGQALELAGRDWRLLHLARKFRPDVMVGNGGVCISHVGKLLGIPSLSLYDTDRAPLQIALALPFIDEWHVPDTWQGRTAPGRTRVFHGVRHFTYLHPDHFRVDDAAALRAGWDPERDNFLLRIVAWQANHDYGRSGIATARLFDLVRALQARGKVHISAEGALPPELEPLRYTGDPLDFHHLLARCRLCCGESVTVASEAAALGVPSLLQLDLQYGYVADMVRAGVFTPFGPQDDLPQLLNYLLAEDREATRQRILSYVTAQDDLNQYVVDMVERVAAQRTGGAKL